MYESLRGRTFLVTGASSGIGRGVAQFLGEQGARVVLNGRRADGVAETLAAMPGDGHVVAVGALGNLDEAALWVDGLAQAHGPLHGIVHCAGIQQACPLRTVTHRHFEQAMQINVEAALGLIKGFRRKGVHAEGGAVVLLASVMGLLGQPLQTVYCATKGALVALTKAAALELAREGIRVNCVAPAIVETGMADRLKVGMTDRQFESIQNAHPLGLGRVSDVANAVAFLLGDTARWVTGTTLTADGGYTAQ